LQRLNPIQKLRCITGNKVLFRELHIKLRKKQGNRDIDCTHLRLERKLTHNHPLEINLKFTHNHVINSAESLSRVRNKVCEKLVELFKDGHSPASALFAYEDELVP